jgi:ribonuclease-3
LETEAIERLEKALGYEFSDAARLNLALAHSSFAHEAEGVVPSNERLEFLGDAVLDLVIAEALYEAHPDWDEGDLTRTRAGLVNQGSLAERARALGVGEFILLGRTERQSQGGEKDSILANCFEALIGAIYLDGGLAPVTDFIRRVYGAALDREAARKRRDVKTEFQEWAHARHQETPRYKTVGDTEVDGDEARFRVRVSVAGEAWGEGEGRSKRIAEQAAASAALSKAGIEVSADV